MKKTIALLIILIATITAWGSVIAFYADAHQADPSATAIAAQAHASLETEAHRLQPQPTTPPVVHLSQGKLLFQGSDSVPEVALTFDDGPSAGYTAQVLSILNQYHVHATFFCIGQQVQEFPSLVHQEYTDGNIVGNHTWDHPDLTTLSKATVDQELTSTSDELTKVNGTAPTFFRPPYGAINKSVQLQAEGHQLTPTLWNIDTEDWNGKTSQQIINTVTTQADNGSIVLMHDGGGNRSQTVAALPTIIQNLQNKGFRLVTVQQLVDDMQKHSNPTTQPTIQPSKA